MQSLHHLCSVRELHLAMRERPVVVLELDVAGPTTARDPSRTVGVGAGLQPGAIEVAIAALVIAKNVLRRHERAAGERRVLRQDVASLVAEEKIVVELAE